MPSITVQASLAAKESMLAFLDVDFTAWWGQQLRAGGAMTVLSPTEESAETLRRDMTAWASAAEIFAVEPVMAAVVKMAAEDLPEEAAFLVDDPPTEFGMLFLADPLLLPPGGLFSLLSVPAVLDVIAWRTTPAGVNVQAWAKVTFADAETATRQPIIQGTIPYGQPFAEIFDDGHADVLVVALTHTLSALRIMQQPYAARTRHDAPRASARRLARRDATSAITVITFRQPQRTDGARGAGDDPAWKLDHRVLVRGHWRRHHRYKNADGLWAEKEIYISPYIRGPEDAPLIITKKVNDLIR